MAGMFIYKGRQLMKLAFGLGTWREGSLGGSCGYTFDSDDDVPPTHIQYGKHVRVTFVQDACAIGQLITWTTRE